MEKAAEYFEHRGQNSPRGASSARQAYSFLSKTSPETSARPDATEASLALTVVARCPDPTQASTFRRRMWASLRPSSGSPVHAEQQERPRWSSTSTSLTRSSATLR